jgi:uncharacterized protein (TIGR01777 family)
MIVVTGASGFVGRALCDALITRGIRVVTVGRRGDAEIRWPQPGDSFRDRDLDLLKHARGVVNLAGENIGRRWTRSRRRALRESRVARTTALTTTLAALDPRPRTLISASAMGYYGNRGDEWLEESSAPGSDFLATLVRDWEAATRPAVDAGIRVVQMRLGIVIGPGGIFARVRLPFQLGVGGRLGDGDQWMSWIAIGDVVNFIIRAIDDAAFGGPVNLSSPDPVTNAEFTRLLGKVLHRPTVFPAPEFALRLAFGEMADGLLLTSHRLRPAKLIANRFAYTHTSMEEALRAAVENRSA